MAFVLKTHLTIQEVTSVAVDAAFDPLRDRVMSQTATSMHITECRQSHAYMFSSNGVGNMYESFRGHYLFFCFGRFFDIRGKHFYQPQVSFHNFPVEFASRRSEVEALFKDAAQVHGWFGDPADPESNALFVPVFGPDDAPLEFGELV